MIYATIKKFADADRRRQTQTDADRRKPHRHRSSNSSLDFIIGLGYAFCVVMTVFVMEDHPKKVKICLLVNLGLGAARFIILVCSIAVGLMTGAEKFRRIFWPNASVNESE